MKKFAVFGNCQAPLIAQILLSVPAFASNFELIELPGVHEMTSLQMENLHASVQELSLFIFQNVDRDEISTQRLKERLSNQCIAISIPSLFFNAYNPEVTYIRQDKANIFYHDRIQLKCRNDFHFFESALCNDPEFFPRKFSEKCLYLSINELARREDEQCLDIRMSKFILNNFQEKRLFHVLNHPCQDLLREVCSKILNYLGINAKIEYNLIKYSLDWWQFPIYVSHYKNLDMKFVNEFQYVWDAQIRSPKIFFQQQIERYSRLSQEILDSQGFGFLNPVLKGWDLAAEFDFLDA